jgi:hypothetical protein
MVETSVVSETMISVYGTVAVSVTKTTSPVGVLDTFGQLRDPVTQMSPTYMVVTTGDPNIDTHAERWTTGLLST